MEAPHNFPTLQKLEIRLTPTTIALFGRDFILNFRVSLQLSVCSAQVSNLCYSQQMYDGDFIALPLLSVCTVPHNVDNRIVEFTLYFVGSLDKSMFVVFLIYCLKIPFLRPQ